MFATLVTGQTVGRAGQSPTLLTFVLHTLMAACLVLLQTPRVTENVFTNIALKLYLYMKYYFVDDHLFLLSRLVITSVTLVAPVVQFKPAQT